MYPSFISNKKQKTIGLLTDETSEGKQNETIEIEDVHDLAEDLLEANLGNTEMLKDLVACSGRNSDGIPVFPEFPKIPTGNHF